MCSECGHLTEVEEGENQSSRPCAQCDAEGEDDPYCTELVRITFCTYTGEGACPDKNHHFGFGQHVVEVPE